MLRSMTGFGRAEAATSECKISVELKSVNHRYCEMTIKTPKKLGYFDAGVRALLKQYIQRGKVDVFIGYEDYAENDETLHYNAALAGEYYNILKQISAQFQLTDQITALNLAQCPDVITTDEKTVDEDELWNELAAVVRQAAENFNRSREAEGENLKKDLLGKLDGLLRLVTAIEERSPQIVEEYRNRLIAKVAELLGEREIDETALATEITMFADKICVDEETVRLRSHIQAMADTLNDGDGIGRKLDFIAQEMNREANTILSKANDIEVTDMAIALKTEIEKIREQIQNIE